MSIPTTPFTYNTVSMVWAVPSITWLNPATGQPESWTAADLDLPANAATKTAILDDLVGATPADNAVEVRTNYKMSGQTYLNTDAQDYVVNGGTIDYDKTTYYGGRVFKAAP